VKEKETYMYSVFLETEISLGMHFETIESWSLENFNPVDLGQSPRQNLNSFLWDI
jgi:hypothetical protein